ncbi:unnamed protein product, partial [Discosporangium mesarthrocarpum]
MCWIPPSTPDFACIGLAAAHQFLVLLAVVHLAWCRHWPPYVVKNVILVCVAGVAGAVHFIGVIISFGFFRHARPSLLTNCVFQGYVLWTGAGLWHFSAFIRVYRKYKVLIKHSANMMHSTKQTLLMQCPVWLIGVPAIIHSSASQYNFDANRCTGGTPLLLVVYNYAGLWLLVAVWLMYKMRNVRRQVECKPIDQNLGIAQAPT